MLLRRTGVRSLRGGKPLRNQARTRLCIQRHFFTTIPSPPTCRVHPSFVQNPFSAKLTSPSSFCSRSCLIINPLLLVFSQMAGRDKIKFSTFLRRNICFLRNVVKVWKTPVIPDEKHGHLEQKAKSHVGLIQPEKHDPLLWKLPTLSALVHKYKITTCWDKAAPKYR